MDNGPAREREVRTTELPLAAATLGFRGYPRQVDGETPGDLTYRYEEASTTGPFSRFRGSYTQYGDVTPLLTSVDNHFAIFGTGEDIDAEFDTAALPALSARLEARLFLLRERLRERHGLLRGDSVHRGRDAVPWHEHISISRDSALSR